MGRIAALLTLGIGSAGAREGAEPPVASRATVPTARMTGLDVIRESIFGAASKDDWRPLDLATFFSEGWDEPFVNAPEGGNGAPKQPWLLTGTGRFARAASSICSTPTA